MRNRNGLDHGLGIHVVQQDRVGPRPGRLGHLVEGVALDLDHPPRPQGPARLDRRRLMVVPARWLSLTNTASERLARWLVATAGPHGSLLKQAKSRRRLAGVEDAN